MSQQHQTINNSTRATAAAGLVDGRVLTCALQHGPVPGGGPFRGFGFDRPNPSPARLAKAQAYHAALVERRKNPANCCRCGKPRDDARKQCSKCRAYQAKYRGRLLDRDAKLTGSVVIAMVKQMRREMDRMQARFKQWQKAAEYRRNLHYRTNTMRRKYLKTFTPAQVRDYLAQTNHAHEREEA